MQKSSSFSDLQQFKGNQKILNPNNLELDHVPQFGKNSRLSVSNNSSKSDNQYNKSDHSTRE
jgi:hypothetical protein